MTASRALAALLLLAAAHHAVAQRLASRAGNLAMAGALLQRAHAWIAPAFRG